MAQEIADSTLLDTWSSSGAKIEPDISKIIEGWQLGEQPPHEYMNWLQNTLGSKLNHILKNGVASWNNETEYEAGSSVQHNSNIWLCKTTNTNSEPTDANANWKRIITVEALITVLAGYVATTGDQTIAGVKTFSSNPISSASQSTNVNALTKYSAVVKNSGNETIAGIKTFTSSLIVPTPTAATQAANKEYVDNTLLNPILTANATLTGIDNKIVMNGIVSSLGLEIGDVIQFTSVANANNQKLRTVEIIINDNEIIVNYEHCGSRGNGSLKLSDETLTNATIKRIAKWYNAPIGLGQAWVDVTASRFANTDYIPPYMRSIEVSISHYGGVDRSVEVSSNGSEWMQLAITGNGATNSRSELSAQFSVNSTDKYRSNFDASIFSLSWLERR